MAKMKMKKKSKKRVVYKRQEKLINCNRLLTPKLLTDHNNKAIAIKCSVCFEIMKLEDYLNHANGYHKTNIEDEISKVNKVLAPNNKCLTTIQFSESLLYKFSAKKRRYEKYFICEICNKHVRNYTKHQRVAHKRFKEFPFFKGISSKKTTLKLDDDVYKDLDSNAKIKIEKQRIKNNKEIKGKGRVFEKGSYRNKYGDGFWIVKKK